MVTALEICKQIKNALSEKTEGVFSPDFEAREIVKEYSGSDPLISPYKPLSDEQREKINAAVSRRLSGEPLQYIFGKWEFYGYEFFVGKGVLIPRPETELLVDSAVSLLKKNSSVLDLCSGTGCIPICISLKTGASCLAVELYSEAYCYLERNIKLHGADVRAVLGDALDETLLNGESFDLICTNPPYLTSLEMHQLQKELTFEPETALFGGEDGLDFYKKLIPLWSGRLKTGGAFITEIGETQGEAVSEIMRSCGLSPAVKKDYSGLDRVVIGIS